MNMSLVVILWHVWVDLKIYIPVHWPYLLFIKWPTLNSNVITSKTSLVVQGLIFVVDSNDRERVAESAEELSKMVSSLLNKKNSFILCNSVPIMLYRDSKHKPSLYRMYLILKYLSPFLFFFVCFLLLDDCPPYCRSLFVVWSADWFGRALEKHGFLIIFLLLLSHPEASSVYFLVLPHCYWHSPWKWKMWVYVCISLSQSLSPFTYWKWIEVCKTVKFYKIIIEFVDK